MRLARLNQKNIIAAVLRGHYSYYGLTGNGHAISEYLHRVTRACAPPVLPSAERDLTP